VGRYETDVVGAAATVGQARHLIRIESVLNRPFPPGSFDLRGGVDQQPVEIEKHRVERHVVVENVRGSGLPAVAVVNPYSFVGATDNNQQPVTRRAGGILEPE
jgi:hypothetical protein